MTELVTMLLIFIAVGAGFLTVNMAVGRLIRPDRPTADKKMVYECGEPSVGESWIQFDLRFYVVALLFVIFDVEMVFFFPWAMVFGNANKLAQTDLTVEQRVEYENAILPGSTPVPVEDVAQQQAAARKLAWLGFADILFFFSVLLVGFAYLWRRGDLDWVRSVAAQAGTPPRVLEN